MISEKDRKSEERIDYFLRRITDENPGNRWKAIEALARTGDARAVDPLVAALSDVDWRVRQKAAWALGFLGDPAALGPLRHALRDESEGVRDMALEALDEIKRKMIEND